jgi:hypothetical protein
MIRPALVGLALTVLGAVTAAEAAPTAGPLRVSSENPRYFADETGAVVYLTGSHYWFNLQDSGQGRVAPFDFPAYLDFLQRHNHNFIRLWTWEQAAWAPWGPERELFAPPWYARTGAGLALDGQPRFDLDRFEERYFERLRARVAAARDRGVYVMVMLFQGWSTDRRGMRGNPWPGHPYNGRNNANGLDGDADGDGQGRETHTLAVSAVTRRQEAYIRKVVDTLNDLDNVLYEVSNESHRDSTAWQYHVMDVIRAAEAEKPQRHPVVMTIQHPGGSNAVLLASTAEAISPRYLGPWRADPPPADGRKVILSDTDHHWGLGGDRRWVWKSFLRGHNPIYMDPYTSAKHRDHPSRAQWDGARRAMGQTLAFARRMNLAALVPRGDLTSTGYCLAGGRGDGAEYLVYLPEGGEATVHLLAPGRFAVEWSEPSTGRTVDGGVVPGGGRRVFRSPLREDAVLYLRIAEGTSRGPRGSRPRDGAPRTSGRG